MYSHSLAIVLTQTGDEEGFPQDWPSQPLMAPPDLEVDMTRDERVVVELHDRPRKELSVEERESLVQELENIRKEMMNVTKENFEYQREVNRYSVLILHNSLSLSLSHTHTHTHTHSTYIYQLTLVRTNHRALSYPNIKMKKRFQPDYDSGKKGYPEEGTDIAISMSKLTEEEQTIMQRIWQLKREIRVNSYHITVYVALIMCGDHFQFTCCKFCV